MVTSKVMISIKREGNPEITIRSMIKERNPHRKHPRKVNASNARRNVTTEMSVDPRPKP